MKKIYFHAGPWKTGTTSLQYFLFSNRQVFENNGYGLFYPRNPINFDEGIDDVADLMKKIGWEQYSTVDFNEYINNTNFDHYIFSEETMYLDAIHKRINSGVIKAFNENDLTIILTARRIDNVSLSLWKHRSSFLQGHRNYKATINPSTYNYYTIAQGYLQSYPHAKIKIRSYEYPYGGDNRKDFLYAIDYNGSQDFVYDDIRHNPSVTLDVVYAVWYLKDKYKLEPYRTTKQNPLRQAIFDYSARNPEEPNTHILDRVERQNLINSLKYSTEQCEKLYYNGKRLHPPLGNSVLYRPTNTKIVRVAEEIMEIAKLKGADDEIFDLW